MQQFVAHAFYTVVRWHKLGEGENECTSHNYIVVTGDHILISWWPRCDKNHQIWWRFDEVLTKTKWEFFWPTL